MFRRSGRRFADKNMRPSRSAAKPSGRPQAQQVAAMRGVATETRRPCRRTDGARRVCAAKNGSPRYGCVHTRPPAAWTRGSVCPGCSFCGRAAWRQTARPQTWRKQAMKTGFAVLAGVGVLSLAVGVSGADAATRHYQHRHVAKSPVMSAPAPGAEYTDLATNGNNPAKKSPARQISDAAVKTGTL